MTDPHGSGAKAGADIDQIVYALERARDNLQARADEALRRRDYSGEFPFEDAQRMREAIELLRGLDAQRRAPPAPQDEEGGEQAPTAEDTLPQPTFHVRWHSAYRGYTLCAKGELGGIGLFTGDQVRKHAAKRVEGAMTRVLQGRDWVVPFTPITGAVVTHPELGELYDRVGVHSYALSYAQAAVTSMLGGSPDRLLAATATMPMQPVVMVEGVIRFKANEIVKRVLEHSERHGFDLHELSGLEFTAEERMQFVQLLGYSVSGYGDLPYVSEVSYEAAARRAVAAYQPLDHAAEAQRGPQ